MVDDPVPTVTEIRPPRVVAFELHPTALAQLRALTWRYAFACLVAAGIGTAIAIAVAHQLGVFSLKIAFNRGALFSAFVGRWGVLIGVYRSDFGVYVKGENVQISSGWLWGSAIEEYDHCLDYWGFGPFVLVTRCV